MLRGVKVVDVDVSRKKTTSTLAMHCLTEGHAIDFEHAKTVARIDHDRARIFREAIEIEKRPLSMNTRGDALRLPAAWKPVLTVHQVTRYVTAKPDYGTSSSTSTPGTSMKTRLQTATRKTPIQTHAGTRQRACANHETSFEPQNPIG